MSQNATGVKPRLRAPAFTDLEDEALIKAYSEYRGLIRGRNAMGVSQRTRLDAWEAVTNAVNAVGRYERTVKSVKIHYGNMLAEYKSYKSNDKTSRNLQQNPQRFYKYFDELFGEKSAGVPSSADVSEEFSGDGSDDLFNQRNQNLLAAFCGGNENLSELVACLTNGGDARDKGALHALVNSLTTNGSGDTLLTTKNGAADVDNLMQSNYLTFLQNKNNGRVKQELMASNRNDGSSMGMTTNTSLAGVNTTSSNIAMLLSGSLMNNGTCDFTNVSSNGFAPPSNKRRRDSNAPALPTSLAARNNSTPSSAAQNTEPKPCVELKASAQIHRSVAKRSIAALRVKLLEKQVAVLELKEEVMRKKNRLLDLKILGQQRALEQGVVPCKASDSMDTTIAFGESILSVDRDDTKFTHIDTNPQPARKMARVTAVNVLNTSENFTTQEETDEPAAIYSPESTVTSPIVFPSTAPPRKVANELNNDSEYNHHTVISSSHASLL